MSAFLTFIIEERYTFACSGELDDLVVEWKNSRFPSRSEFEAVIAAIEVALPSYKHCLPWAKSVSAAWGVTATQRHTVPLCEGPAIFLACHLSAMRHPRMGAGMILQKTTGMRPSELLGLERQDIMLAEDRGLPPYLPAVLGLGIRAGTKAKRAQTVTVESPPKLALLRWLCDSCQPGEKLIGYSYESYRRVLGKAADAAGLADVGYTPHSPRSGFASDMIAAGMGFDRTREAGRWLSESSLRVYIDLNSAAAIQVNLKTQKLNSAVAYTVANMLQFFPGSDGFLSTPPSQPESAACHASVGLHEEGGRLLPAASECRAYGIDSIEVGDIDPAAIQHSAPEGGKVRGRGRGSGRGRRDAEARGQAPEARQRARGRGRRGAAASAR